MNMNQIPIKFILSTASEICYFQMNNLKASSRNSHLQLSATQMMTVALRW